MLCIAFTIWRQRRGGCARYLWPVPGLRGMADYVATCSTEIIAVLA